MKKALAILAILSGCANETNGSENSSLINQESSRDSFLSSSVQVNLENIHSFSSKKFMKPMKYQF